MQNFTFPGERCRAQALIMVRKFRKQDLSSFLLKGMEGWLHPNRTGSFFSGVCFLAFFCNNNNKILPYYSVPAEFPELEGTDVSVGNWHLSHPLLWCALPSKPRPV